MMANNTCDRLETLTPSGTYGLYLGFVVIGYVLAYFCYPETSEFIFFHTERRITYDLLAMPISPIRGPIYRRSFQSVR